MTITDQTLADLKEKAESYLIVKRGLYYRPNSAGYTGLKEQAGRYTYAEAKDHADAASGVSFIAEAEAPEYSPKCFDDVARKHLEARCSSLIAEIEALREGGWRPIETAPKDGTPFLAFQANHAPQYFACWLEIDTLDGSYWMDAADTEPAPTDWRPLPAPPALNKEAQP